tara:strand:- start:11201 stop:11776 length:576 start_codon:yes stop_codon:yes gene_type:complete
MSDLKDKISENIKLHKKLISLESQINKSISIIYNALNKGGKILLCGNGGSAADAQHLAAEFLVRLRPKINRHPIPAITLAQDTSTITACGNDYSYNDIFLRSFTALAGKNDVLIAISTSGNSKNIIKVLKYAKKNNYKTIGFLGKTGGIAKKFCHIDLKINSTVTARIQECHIFIGHYIFEKVEDLIISKK